MTADPDPTTPGATAAAGAPPERTTITDGGPRPRPQHHPRHGGREPAVPAGTVADYLDAVRYRRYSRSVLLERRRLLGQALVVGGDAWLAATPPDEVAATVAARLGIESAVTHGRLRRAAGDYQAWLRRREGP